MNTQELVAAIETGQTFDILATMEGREFVWKSVEIQTIEGDIITISHNKSFVVINKNLVPFLTFTLSKVEGSDDS